MDQKFTLVFETTTGIVEWVVDNEQTISRLKINLKSWEQKFIDIAGTLYNVDHIVSVKIVKWPLYLKYR